MRQYDLVVRKQSNGGHSCEVLGDALTLTVAHIKEEAIRKQKIKWAQLFLHELQRGQDRDPATGKVLDFEGIAFEVIEE